MSKKGIIVAAALIAAFVGALSTNQASAATRSFDEVYFRCPSGYAFETSGSAVHCKKPAWTETRALASCPIGLYASVDRVGTKDMCAGTNPISGEIDVEQGCNATDIVQGYSKRVVAGKDFCGKNHPAEVVAPTIAVTL